MEQGKAGDTNYASKVALMTETLKLAQPEQTVSAQDVDRILAVGRLLLSVLTPEELEFLRIELFEQRSGQDGKTIIGNASSS
jgi:hypothetical protein